MKGLLSTGRTPSSLYMGTPLRHIHKHIHSNISKELEQDEDVFCTVIMFLTSSLLFGVPKAICSNPFVSFVMHIFVIQIKCVNIWMKFVCTSFNNIISE